MRPLFARVCEVRVLQFAQLSTSDSGTLRQPMMSRAGVRYDRSLRSRGGMGARGGGRRCRKRGRDALMSCHGTGRPPQVSSHNGRVLADGLLPWHHWRQKHPARPGQRSSMPNLRLAFLRWHVSSRRQSRPHSRRARHRAAAGAARQPTHSQVPDRHAGRTTRPLRSPECPLRHRGPPRRDPMTIPT